MFFELIYGSGPLAALLFIAIAVVFFRDAMTLAIQSESPFVHRVIFGVMSAFFLGSIFGADLRDVVNSPFAWLLVGWTVRGIVDRAGQEEWLAAPAHSA